MIRVGSSRRSCTLWSRGSGFSPRASGPARMLAVATASWIARLIPMPPIGLADRQQARAVPAIEPVECHRQQVQVVLALQPARACEVEFGERRLGLLAYPADPARPHFRFGALGTEEGGLPVAPPVDQHDHAPGIDRSPDALAGLLRFRQAKPEHVHRRAELRHRQHLAPAHQRGAPVRHDHQLAGAQGPPVAQRHACNPACFLDEAGHLRFHVESEIGKGLRLVAQEVEEIPLRHHRDERRRGIEMRQVSDRVVFAGDTDLRTFHPVVGALQETAEHSQLVQDLHRRGMDRVAAEIAEEVGMLFEHPDRHSRAGEQQPGHDPRRPAADYQHIGRCRAHRLSDIER